ncbi:MAG: hypothetical protein GY906_38730 [bacterium]|nr:hypothetical protein [bacterium]
MTDQHRLIDRWEKLSAFVRLCLISPFVAGPQLLNVLLVGRWGEGKTTMLNRFRCNPWIDYIDDVTEFGLHRPLSESTEGRLTTIVLPDFGAICARGPREKTTIGLLASAIEEGVYKVEVGPNRAYHFPDGARLQLLTAMTHYDFAQYLNLLTIKGFLTRFIPVNASFTDDEHRVMYGLSRGGDSPLTKECYMGTASGDWPGVWPITVPEEYQSWIEGEVNYMRKHSPHLYAGQRTWQRFQLLLQSSARLHGRGTVTDDDVAYLMHFRVYWRRPPFMPIAK